MNYIKSLFPNGKISIKKDIICLMLVILLLFLGISLLLVVRPDYKYHINENGTITLDKYTGNAKKVCIPNIILFKKVTEIRHHCFWKNESIEEVYIPENIEIIGGEAFYGCSKLLKITGGENVVDIHISAFARCKLLQEIFPLTKVKDISSTLFAVCENLEYVELADDTRFIGDYAFNKTKIKYDNIPQGVEYVGEGAYWGLSEENSFMIVGDHVLVRYPYEEKVQIPQGVKVISVNNNTDRMITQEIVVPNTVKFIGKSIFEGAISGVLYIPESVTAIGEYDFENQYYESKLYDVGKICGIKGSYAEDYAKRYNIPFEEVERWY